MAFPSHAAQCCKESHSVKDYEVQDYLAEEWDAKIVKVEFKKISEDYQSLSVQYEMIDGSELELVIVLDSQLKFKRHNWRAI